MMGLWQSASLLEFDLLLKSLPSRWSRRLAFQPVLILLYDMAWIAGELGGRVTIVDTGAMLTEDWRESSGWDGESVDSLL